MAKQGSFNFDKIIRKLEDKKPRMLTDLERLSTTHFINSWRKQGWEDNSLEPWKEVERRKPGTAAYKSATKAARTRAILVKSGALRRGFYTRIKRMNIIQIANSMPYAKVHNEGLKIRGGMMPKRQFMGHSQNLEKQQVIAILQWINSAVR